MVPFPALMLCVVFLALAALHAYWAFSGRLGGSGVVPTVNGAPIVCPGRASTLAVAALFLAAAMVSMWRGACPDAGPSWVPQFGVWIITFLFAARAIGEFRYVGFFKTVRGTAFARNDTLFFSPLCVIISVLAVCLAAFY